jgi:predicted nucleotidyltransferase
LRRCSILDFQMVALDPIFKEFISLLNAHGVEYLIVGGVAVAQYGRPRYTGDIDIWIAVSDTNAKNVLQSIHEFGFGSIGLSLEDFLQHDVVIQLGREPLRIYLMTSLTDLHFLDCYLKANIIELDGISVRFIHINDLRKNKIATGRAKDLFDLESLPEV